MMKEVLKSIGKSCFELFMVGGGVATAIHYMIKFIDE